MLERKKLEQLQDLLAVINTLEHTGELDRAKLIEAARPVRDFVAVEIIKWINRDYMQRELEWDTRTSQDITKSSERYEKTPLDEKAKDFLNRSPGDE